MDYNDYLRLHQTALTLLGLWPQPSSRLYWLYTVVFLGFFCILFNISELSNVFFIYSDLKMLASNLIWSLVHLVICLKIFVFLSNVEKVKSICNRFRSGLFLAKDFNAEEEIQLAVKKGLSYLYVYYLFSVVVLLNGFIAPIYRDNGEPVENRTRLPYFTYILCDEHASPCYEAAYIYQTLSTSICSLVLIHCDNLYIVLVMLSCSQFKILQRSLRSITQRAEASVKMKWRKAGVRRLDCEIKKEALRLGNDCVRHHHAILEVSRDLENMYNLLLLAQFLSHVVQLCFQMFVITKVSLLSFDGLSMIAFATAMVIEVHVFCQCGNDIETESRKISQAAYDADWISASEPLKDCRESLQSIIAIVSSMNCDSTRTLLLMMLRAEHPVQFTAGKFVKLSRSTLVQVLRGSLSYFVVLREVQ